MSRISQLKHSRKTVEEELERIESRAAHIERLGELEPEGRNRVYKMQDLTVLAYGNGGG